jgi:hypothetical protein
MGIWEEPIADTVMYSVANMSRLKEKFVSSLTRSPISRIMEYAVQQPVRAYVGIWEGPIGDTVMYSVCQICRD